MKPSRPVFVFSIGLASVFLAPFAGAPISDAPLASLTASLIAMIAGVIAWGMGGKAVNEMSRDDHRSSDVLLAKVGYGLGVGGTLLGLTIALVTLLTAS
ncbi:MAG: hypothetical protein OXT69_08515 [Candidatus Poribacteria bacterium]|nr:hypothetical protein [Candidatus Poribacteria bacterium]